MAKSKIVGMRNFQDTFKTRNRSLISAFSICMIAPLIFFIETGKILVFKYHSSMQNDSF